MEIKKNPKADLRKRRTMFFFGALTITLSLVLTAFEWKSYQEPEILTFDDGTFIIDIVDIPPTVQLPPPPPKVELPQIEEVPDDQEIELEEEFIIDAEPVDYVEPLEFTEPPEEEVDDHTFIFVEDKPEFPGGDAAMFKYLAKNIKYPRAAKRTETSGRVFIQFVVQKDGSITDVQAIKGIGAGCDVEAARVVEEMPRWTPGKQRGVPVKVRMIIPIYFELSR